MRFRDCYEHIFASCNDQANSVGELKNWIEAGDNLESLWIVNWFIDCNYAGRAKYDVKEFVQSLPHNEKYSSQDDSAYRVKYFDRPVWFNLTCFIATNALENAHTYGKGVGSIWSNHYIGGKGLYVVEDNFEFGSRVVNSYQTT